MSNLNDLHFKAAFEEGKAEAVFIISRHYRLADALELAEMSKEDFLKYHRELKDELKGNLNDTCDLGRMRWEKGFQEGFRNEFRESFKKAYLQGAAEVAYTLYSEKHCELKEALEITEISKEGFLKYYPELKDELKDDLSVEEDKDKLDLGGFELIWEKSFQEGCLETKAKAAYNHYKKYHNLENVFYFMDISKEDLLKYYPELKEEAEEYFAAKEAKKMADSGKLIEAKAKAKTAYNIFKEIHDSEKALRLANISKGLLLQYYPELEFELEGSLTAEKAEKMADFVHQKEAEAAADTAYNIFKEFHDIEKALRLAEISKEDLLKIYPELKDELN